jgi:hypothetical protein
VFSKDCSCHLQGEYVCVGYFWKPYIAQALDSELDLMVLFGGAKNLVAFQSEMSKWLRKRGDEIFFIP